MQGDVLANRQVTLHKTARVVGDIHTVGLVIEEGAVLNGKIEMGKGKDTQTEPSPPGPAKADLGKDKGPLSPGQRN